MTKTEQEFLQILRAAVLGEPLPEGFSVGEAGALFALARRHDLGHLLSVALEGTALSRDSELFARSERERLRALWRSGVLSHEEERVTAFLDREGIPYIPLKGAVVRALWPEPWMRTSCDLDILVREEDAGRAALLLCRELGYTARGETYHNHSLYSEGDAVHLELHFSLTEGGTSDAVLARAWEHATPADGARYVLSPEFLLFHLVSHLATHLLNGGGGVRPIVDVFLVRQQLAYDAAGFAELAREAGLLTFSEAVFSLSEAWLGEGEPAPVSERLGAALLGGRLYSDTDRRAAVEKARRTGREARREARRARRRYFRARLFPGRDRLRVLYPALERHAFLLPFCYLHRLVRLLFGRRLALALERGRASAGVTEEEKTEALALLSSLGLMP